MRMLTFGKSSHSATLYVTTEFIVLNLGMIVRPGGLTKHSALRIRRPTWQVISLSASHKSSLGLGWFRPSRADLAYVCYSCEVGNTNSVLSHSAESVKEICDAKLIGIKSSRQWLSTARCKGWCSSVGICITQIIWLHHFKSSRLLITADLLNMSRTYHWRRPCPLNR